MSEKPCKGMYVHTISKKVCLKKCILIGTVCGFEITVLQRNLKEWHNRPWKYEFASAKLGKQEK